MPVKTFVYKFMVGWKAIIEADECQFLGGRQLKCHRRDGVDLRERAG